MRGADKWFCGWWESILHQAWYLDCKGEKKEKEWKLLLHSVPAVGSPAVQQTRWFLLMTLYILCTLSGVCKSCKHTQYHTEGMAHATSGILRHDFLNTGHVFYFYRQCTNDSQKTEITAVLYRLTFLSLRQFLVKSHKGIKIVKPAWWYGLHIAI